MSRKLGALHLAGRTVGLGLAVGSMLGCGPDVSWEAPADTIYYAGPILTLEGDTPRYVEALAVAEGRIARLGTRSEVFGLRGASTRLVDLQGRALLPGFIDAHGHVWSAGLQELVANLLPPPDGDASDVASVVEQLAAWAEANSELVEKLGWILGFGYDDAQLAEGRHPEAADLDRVSTELPVFAIHQSGHLGAMNRAALEASGITADRPDPEGGVIRREADGRTPNGVLEEAALFAPLFGLLERFDPETREEIGLAGVQAYLRFGFTTAQDGRATAAIAETWRRLGGAGRLPIDVAVYPDLQNDGALLESAGTTRDYANRVRIAGAKLSLDGSPQGKTAWLTEPYLVPPAGQPADYAGYPAIPDATVVDALVARAFEQGWQLLAHANGDAAADQLLAAVSKATEEHGPADRRTVVIHAQTVREDQLDRMRDLGILPSFFAMHTFYWGDWHRDETLGPERAYRISPTASALARGMRFTLHHDAPVVLPSSPMILHTAVNRTSRSGDVIGPDQRVSAYVALKAITEWAAYQAFEEDRKGTLAAGKLADLVILDADPLAVDPGDLRQLRVLETVKEGVTVHAAP